MKKIPWNLKGSIDSHQQITDTQGAEPDDFVFPCAVLASKPKGWFRLVMWSVDKTRSSGGVPAEDFHLPLSLGWGHERPSEYWGCLFVFIQSRKTSLLAEKQSILKSYNYWHDSIFCSALSTYNYIDSLMPEQAWRALLFKNLHVTHLAIQIRKKGYVLWTKHTYSANGHYFCEYILLGLIWSTSKLWNTI